MKGIKSYLQRNIMNSEQNVNLNVNINLPFKQGQTVAIKSLLWQKKIYTSLFRVDAMFNLS